MYELRISYSANLTLGEADVLAPYDDLDTAAVAFVECGIPFKQLIHLDDQGLARLLNDDEQAILERVCGSAGCSRS